MNNNKRSKLSTVPSSRPIRVGFVGFSGGKGWVAKTHFMAIQQLSSQFQIVALYNDTLDSSIQTIQSLKLRHATAFDSLELFAQCKDIDMIVVSVKVPEHYEVLKVILEHSLENLNLRYLYVEWTLASDTKKAEEIYSITQDRTNLQTIICLQGRKSPYIVRAKELISEGCIGDITSIEISGNGGWYGYERPMRSPEFLYDIESGVNLISNTFGHTIDVLQYITGSYFEKINAMISNNIPVQFLLDENGKRTKETIGKTCPDHLLFQGILQNGKIPVSCSFNGGTPVKKLTKNLVIDIHGTKGDLKIEGDAGFVEISNLVLYFYGIKNGNGANGTPTSNGVKNSNETNEKKAGNSPTPPSADEEATMEVFHLRNYNSLVGNILRIYESIADFHFLSRPDVKRSANSKDLLPSNKFEKQGFKFEGFPTFKDAIILHRLIDAVFLSDRESKTLDVSKITI
ncbi:unnamed protein product [Kluyveromyces dobzhanskii CBS 2104]|uniref:WGS project CCBQ000000000 data, contig 00107 n=1 Tax=Kluyveromyces dobzhanskii CBS 2104 TaxID=1427455 RepID=A0A0A8L185_9SACH|nr:unnamed protein product [Kluyveromyces dobzhanskii CBS 2104]